MPLMRSPSNTIWPRVTSPSSVLSRPEIAFRVVDLPAPLAPSSATISPLRTSRLNPRSTRMTLSYTTSMLRTASSAAGAGPGSGWALVCNAAILLLRMPPARGGSGTVPVPQEQLPTEPVGLARQIHGADLLKLDRAVLDQIGNRSV